MQWDSWKDSVDRKLASLELFNDALEADEINQAVAKVKNLEAQYVSGVIKSPIGANAKIIETQSLLTNVQSKIAELERKIEGHSRTRSGGERESGYFAKSVLESKAVQGIKTLVDATHYREWNKKLKNIMDQIKPGSREINHHDSFGRSCISGV